MFVDIVFILCIVFLVGTAMRYIIIPAAFFCFLVVLAFVCGIVYVFALCYHACKRQPSAKVNGND